MIYSVGVDKDNFRSRVAALGVCLASTPEQRSFQAVSGLCHVCVCGWRTSAKLVVTIIRRGCCGRLRRRQVVCQPCVLLTRGLLCAVTSACHFSLLYLAVGFCAQLAELALGGTPVHLVHVAMQVACGIEAMCVLLGCMWLLLCGRGSAQVSAPSGSVCTWLDSEWVTVSGVACSQQRALCSKSILAQPWQRTGYITARVVVELVALPATCRGVVKLHCAIHTAGAACNGATLKCVHGAVCLPLLVGPLISWCL
jgi:hypothetical protein